MNMNLIAEKLIAALTEPVYYSQILPIADILGKIELDPQSEDNAKALGIDVETFTVKKVLDALKGEARYLKESKDVMDSFTTTSTDAIANKMGFDRADEYISGEGNIENFVNLGSEIQKHDIRSYQEKIEVVLDILKQVEAGGNLDTIKVQGQTAHKWLGDLLRYKDGEQYQDAVDTIRSKAKDNTYKGTKTQRIKASISEEDLKNMSCEALAKKYPTLLDYNNGSDRKLVSRLKLRLAK